MSTLKNKGKRPIVHDSHDPPIKKRSTSSSTPKLTTRISSKSQEQENATETDVKVPDTSSKKLCDNHLVKRRTSVSSSCKTERHQSSNSKNDGPSFVCEICVEHKTANDSFSIQGCSHAYCTRCMSKYVASKLQENIIYIRCPLADCKGSLEPEYCHKILPQDVFDRWNKALCEDVIPGAQKFYCPFKSCSALMITDGEVIMESECPHCYRLFCAQCKVPWHAGISCAEFKKLNKNESSSEDMMLIKLAEKKKWKRCPHCRYYVSKKDGCNNMKCRCGHSFCYNCGTLSSTTSHLCAKCMH
ncbi:probable E3 ubiquitin-protein ligase RNF217 isoform X2 [Pistacia vera]|uniref:probable E3 ubiquitin-protein ligase RNF217 isoform X2 n=1 Tax=Pistacia vera TaxID=55513 RepID=UPI0012638F38|nr:probable E3 ubiquitin-protein ligase RNF217 isoform X2 [Pistacia vera]